MRRWTHGNARINFGFCKGDDNFGGRKRKELDDFLKSLGKQMTLVMYRMEDTERIRFKLREDRRREVREKAENEEAREKEQLERLARNKRWRERKAGTEELDEEDKVLTEAEQRKKKNMEWRLRREGSESSTSGSAACPPGQHSALLAALLAELRCAVCRRELAPPATIEQCGGGHSVCSACTEALKVCPSCETEFIGLNTTLMAVAEVVFPELPDPTSSNASIDFTTLKMDEKLAEQDEEESVDFTEEGLASLANIDDI